MRTIKLNSMLNMNMNMSTMEMQIQMMMRMYMQKMAYFCAPYIT